MRNRKGCILEQTKLELERGRLTDFGIKGDKDNRDLPQLLTVGWVVSKANKGLQRGTYELGSDASSPRKVSRNPLEQC